jgi:hypothetical protein
MADTVFCKQALLKINQEVINMRQNVFLAVFLKDFNLDIIRSNKKVFVKTKVDFLSFGPYLKKFL